MDTGYCGPPAHVSGRGGSTRTRQTGLQCDSEDNVFHSITHIEEEEYNTGYSIYKVLKVKRSDKAQWIKQIEAAKTVEFKLMLITKRICDNQQQITESNSEHHKK